MLGDRTDLIKERIIAYVEKKGKARFMDIVNHIQLISHPKKPSKSAIEKYLNELVEEGRLISWYDKKRYFAIPKDVAGIILDEVMIKSIKGKGATFDDIKARLEKENIPWDYGQKVLLNMVSSGKILNTQRGNVIYYHPPKISVSIKVSSVLTVFISLILLLNLIDRKTFILCSILIWIQAIFNYLREKGFIS